MKKYLNDRIVQNIKIYMKKFNGYDVLNIK